MYFTDDSLLPENQSPLMITAAPYGPMWMPPHGCCFTYQTKFRLTHPVSAVCIALG
jgi:hypothetical protein